MGPIHGIQGKSTMRRRRGFQFVEILSTQGYGRVRGKHPEDAEVEDEMEQSAPSK